MINIYPAFYVNHSKKQRGSPLTHI